MTSLDKLVRTHPVMPFIREADFAVRKPWVHPERRLLDYLLVYIQKGHCRFTVDHIVYDFHAGEFCFIQPGSLNHLEGLTDTVTPFAHFDLFYHPQREQSFPTKPGQIDLSQYHNLMQPRLDDLADTIVPVRLRPNDAVQFSHAMLQMVECWQVGTLAMQLKSQAHAINLFVMLLDSHLSSKPSKTQSSPLNWVTSYLSLNMSERLSVENMAFRSNLSVSRFSVLFKREYGTSPHQFLLDLRIRHAQDLLVTTSLSVDSIASYCGFADIYHFSKVFKQKVGLSPMAFRQRSRDDKSHHEGYQSN